MKKFDLELARKIVHTFTTLVEVDEVCMGMQEDWFWTAKPVWRNGEWITDEWLPEGIEGFSPMESFWATPVIEVRLTNGETRVFNCFVGESEVDALKKIEQEFLCTGGVLSRPAQEYRDTLLVEDFKVQNTPEEIEQLKKQITEANETASEIIENNAIEITKAEEKKEHG